jgi:hypothetical protein
LHARLVERLQQRTISGCALLEGGIFISRVGCVVWPTLLTLLTIPAMLALLSLFFPTSGRVERWFSDRHEAIANRAPAR